MWFMVFKFQVTLLCLVCFDIVKLLKWHLVSGEYSEV